MLLQFLLTGADMHRFALADGTLLRQAEKHVINVVEPPGTTHCLSVGAVAKTASRARTSFVAVHT